MELPKKEFVPATLRFLKSKGDPYLSLQAKRMKAIDHNSLASKKAPSLFSYRSGASTAPRSVVTNAPDTKSYASSRVDMELEFLAKHVEIEREKRRKMN
jgi:hypothetical protein